MDWNEYRRTRRQRTRPLVIAHRGVPGQAPENTLESFALALQQGADVLETDLRITRDGAIVLFHDTRLERMTDGAGPLFAYTLAELKRLRVRRPDGEWSAQQVPTLMELLAMTQGETPLLLELKDLRFLQPLYARRLLYILVDYGVLAKSAIISFNAALVQAIRQTGAEIPVGYVTMQDPIPRQGMDLLGPAWPMLMWNPLYVAWSHRLGGLVAPLDLTPERRLGYYLRLGVDALLADDPAAVLHALKQRGRV
jgi:glycerophosphoryl diester phosphodiesterase